MEVTGGAISTGKSWWYLIDFVWKRGKWVASDPHSNLDLIASDKNGDRIALSHLRSDEAAEMLGVWLAPNGDNKKIISVLKTAAVKWGGQVRRGNSSKDEAWTALHSNISAKLKYPLPACTLSERECKSIMYPAIKAALPKSGITSTICTEIRDGPSQSGGGGVISLFHYMGTARTSVLVEHVFRNTPLGNGIRVCIEDIVIDAGLYGLIWKMKFYEIKKYIEGHSWVFAILEYNNKHKIALNVDHGVLNKKRDGDKSIMSLASTYFTKVADLRAINRIRFSRS